MRSRLHDEYISILGCDVQLSRRCNRRRGESAALSDALLINALSRLRVVRRQDPVIVDRVEVIAIGDRRWKIDAASLRAPGDRVARLLTILQREVAARSNLDRVNRLHRRVSGRYEDQTMRGHWRR